MELVFGYAEDTLTFSHAGSISVKCSAVCFMCIYNLIYIYAWHIQLQCSAEGQSGFMEKAEALNE